MILPALAVLFLVTLLITFPIKDEEASGDFSNGLNILLSALILVAMMSAYQGSASGITIARLVSENQRSEIIKTENLDITGALFQSNPGNISSILNQCRENSKPHIWKNLTYLPSLINAKIKAVFDQRCLNYTVIQNEKNAGSLHAIIDKSFLPASSAEGISYLPKAVLIGILSPWPKDWGRIFSKKRSVFFTMVSIETAIMYFVLPFLLLWILWQRQLSILIPIILSLHVITVYTLATPILGALYRYRYPWWMIIGCLGLAATLHMMSYLLEIRKVRHQQKSM